MDEKAAVKEVRNSADSQGLCEEKPVFSEKGSLAAWQKEIYTIAQPCGWHGASTRMSYEQADWLADMHAGEGRGLSVHSHPVNLEPSLPRSERSLDCFTPILQQINNS